MWQRYTRRRCPRVPHPAQAPRPVLRNVRERRPEAAARVPESARSWGASQFSLIRPGPAGRSPAWDAPVLATKPAGARPAFRAGTLSSAGAK